MTHTEYDPSTHRLGIHSKHLSVTTTTGETLLDDITLNIRQGEFVAIHGQSGAGKSLLATALCGIRFTEKREPLGVEKLLRSKIATAAALLLHLHTEKEAESPVRYQGDVTYSLSEQTGHGRVSLPHDYNILRRNIGFVPQEPLLDGNLTAEDNILIPSRLKQIPVNHEILEEVFRQLDLSEETRQKKAGKLSGGQKSRVAIARALAATPNALVLDEPTANLNPELKDETNQMLESLNRQLGMTVIAVTHEDTLATRRIEMSRGRVVSDSSKADFYSRNSL
ncbi:MAG TPA: ATP-binding cassette domain-containing protein [Candidatus Bathyarchaeia archaeon]|nr:ATP-binding cassette domain-containing protein [Candidatus Bathyarchaeia archaeon]